MTNRIITGTALSLVVGVAAFACSPSPSRTISERADGSAQAVREDALEIPCEPRSVLQTVCQQCHSLPPKNGAPFALVRRSDVIGVRSGVVVRELMIQQLEAHRMPLTPVTIDPEARTVLLDWLRAGAPAVTPSECHEAPPDDGGPEPYDAAPIPPSDACAYPCRNANMDAGASDAGSDAAPE